MFVVLTTKFIQKSLFVSNAVSAEGKVESYNYISSFFCFCSNCTKFYAQVLVRDPIDQKLKKVSVPGGTRCENYLSKSDFMSSVNWKSGTIIPVIYNPKDLNEAFFKGFWNLWSSTCYLLIATVFLFLASFVEPREYSDADLDDSHW